MIPSVACEWRLPAATERGRVWVIGCKAGHFRSEPSCATCGQVTFPSHLAAFKAEHWERGERFHSREFPGPSGLRYCRTSHGLEILPQGEQVAIIVVGQIIIFWLEKVFECMNICHWISWCGRPGIKQFCAKPEIWRDQKILWVNYIFYIFPYEVLRIVNMCFVL